MKPVLIYCYDAYCGWCYGFSPVIKQIWEEYNNQIDFEVMSGGMIINDKPAHISVMADYILQAYKSVEQLSGVKFGDDYLWHLRNPDLTDWYPNSEKPAIAMSVFKEYFPELQVPFAADLQYALHYEGRDLCDDEAYRHLLEKYKIPADEFYEKLHSTEMKEAAYYEFALVKQLQVTGFPCVLLQVEESKFFLVARGFTKYEDVKDILDKILTEA